MHKFGIHFSYPWLLLLLIPAIALTLIPYFRLAKKYRKTRNRITSIVLHIIIMLFSITLFAGMTFSYEIYNDENELILLVDVSETEQQSQETRDRFVQTVLNAGKHDNYKIGIVTFGFDQRYAVPLTTDIESIYDKYLAADLPDTSATNIAAALNYVKKLFNSPQTSKIVLITDGKETDEEADKVVRSVAAQGTRIDVVYIPSEYEGDDVQLIDVELPGYHVSIGEECDIGIKIQSKSDIMATIELYDNGKIDELDGRQIVDIVAGTSMITFNHTFYTEGFHEIMFQISVQNDLLEQNNQYCTYFYVEKFNNILILESCEGESEDLITMLTQENAYNVTLKNIYMDNDIPASVSELCVYDQIILNNISNANLVENDNMPHGFDALLYSYVNDYGGGLFTVGGNDENGDPNAYNREDLYNTLFQTMLPVQAVKYKPPIGVVVVIDRSGSMGDTDSNGITYLEWAKAGAAACLDALDDKDYFGLMSLEETYDMVLPLTSCTQQSTIIAAINSLELGGGTVFTGAIERAGQALRALREVDKRHIIIVTDGLVAESQRKQYESLVKSYYESDKISLSVVAIGLKKDSEYDENTPIEVLDKEGLTSYELMLRAVILGHGRLYALDPKNLSSLTRLMREELKVPDLIGINEELFSPTMYNASSPLFNGIERGEGDNRNKMTVKLGGFYGVLARANAEVVLTGDFSVPIYAQWKLGKGMVGSFMCDLNGTWSFDFMQDANGQRFITNVINNLMPVEKIRFSEITVNFKEYNYINQLSVYSNLGKNQYIRGQIIEMSSEEKTGISLNAIIDTQNAIDSDCYVTLALDASNYYSRCNFVVKKSGVYKIVLTKYDSEGAVLSVFEMHKTFSYSEEYNAFIETTNEDLEKKLSNLAKRVNGKTIGDLEDPFEVFEGFVPSIKKTYDPRFLFIILTIVLFLMDIAVRKFKFKWPHELYREYKNKKTSQKI